tara:strand:- start:51 stop:1130 length:1080 start_codon:yes stop_codon:yes gene_type:complete
MAEITAQKTAEELYNALTPAEKNAYDGVMGMGGFKERYQKNPTSQLVLGDANYEKFKAVADAQAAAPQESFLDKINIFSSASAAEPDKTNINNKYLESLYTPDMQETIFGDRNYFKNQNKLPFSIADLAAKSANLDVFPSPQDFYTSPTYVAKQNVNPYFQGIMSQVPLQNLGFDTSFGVANEPDVEQVDSLGSSEESGISKLLKFIMPGSFLANILPKESPESRGIKNFYRSNYGLTDIGQVGSGIMQGYNPVSGGLLYTLSGGKFGKAPNYGLAGAMQRRIEKILGRRIPQTDASKAKVAELRDLQLREMRDRADRGESLSSIGKTTFSGPGMAFEQKGGGFSVNKDTGQKRFYGGR